MRDSEARAYVRTLVSPALLGVPVAFAAVLFQTAIHDLIHLVWEVIPDELGWSEPAWWYVVLVPGLAGLLVAAAVRLPGHGGHSPLEGLGADPIPPSRSRAFFLRRSRASGSASFSAPRLL